MRDGSFDGQITDLDFENDLSMSEIKTPDQVPDRLDLNHVPESVLRSGVIESLINQNDDLMSRLTVALRRVASLEEKIADARSESTQFKTKYDNLKDQVLVLREQSRLVAERARETEEKNRKEGLGLNDLKEQIQVLEIRYAELYATSQKRQATADSEQAKLHAEMEHQKDFYSRFVRRYSKYRQNMKRAVLTAKEEIHTLRSKRQNQETAIHDLRKNLTETTEYIAEQSKENKLQLSNLTNAYENQICEMRAELEMLFLQNQTLGERSQDYEKLITEKTKLENDLIINERKRQESEINTAAEIADIQKALVRHRNDAKDLAIELDNKNQLLAEQITTVESLAEEKDGLTEQVETLQLLWRDQQNQVERMNEQKNSLQKLNQELSITINEYRREIRELKDRLDAAELKAISTKNETEKKEKMRALLAEKPAAAVQSAPIQREDTLTPEIISKIDKALSSLHAGH